MGGGLTGYDPVFADPLNEFGDPGLRNQIFKPTLEETDPATYRVYVPSYLNVEDNLRYVYINYFGQNHLLSDFVKTNFPMGDKVDDIFQYFLSAMYDSYNQISQIWKIIFYKII